MQCSMNLKFTEVLMTWIGWRNKFAEQSCASLILVLMGGIIFLSGCQTSITSS